MRPGIWRGYCFICRFPRWRVARNAASFDRIFGALLLFLIGFLVGGFRGLSWSEGFLTCFLVLWSGPNCMIFRGLLVCLGEGIVVYLVIRIVEGRKLGLWFNLISKLFYRFFVAQMRFLVDLREEMGVGDLFVC